MPETALSETQWLTERERRAWIGHRAVTSLLDTALDRQLRRDSGISHQTYLILSVLSNRGDQTLSMTALANLANSSQSKMSHAVARLEERGWVTRAKPATSKRFVNATLTEAGFEVVAKAAPGHVAMVKELLFDRLTAEQLDALDAVNSVILEALSDHGFPAPVPLPPMN
jgi:DNA-binding MarR family transcriptional regulator